VNMKVDKTDSVLAEKQQTLEFRDPHLFAFLNSLVPRFVLSLDVKFLDVNSLYASGFLLERDAFLSSGLSMPTLVNAANFGHTWRAVFARALEGECVEVLGLKMYLPGTSHLVVSDLMIWCSFSSKDEERPSSQTKQVPFCFNGLETRRDMIPLPSAGTDMTWEEATAAAQAVAALSGANVPGLSPRLSGAHLLNSAYSPSNLRTLFDARGHALNDSNRSSSTTNTNSNPPNSSNSDPVPSTASSSSSDAGLGKTGAGDSSSNRQSSSSSSQPPSPSPSGSHTQPLEQRPSRLVKSRDAAQNATDLTPQTSNNKNVGANHNAVHEGALRKQAGQPASDEQSFSPDSSSSSPLPALRPDPPSDVSNGSASGIPVNYQAPLTGLDPINASFRASGSFPPSASAHSQAPPLFSFGLSGESASDPPVDADMSTGVNMSVKDGPGPPIPELPSRPAFASAMSASPRPSNPTQPDHLFDTSPNPLRQPSLSSRSSSSPTPLTPTAPSLSNANAEDTLSYSGAHSVSGLSPQPSARRRTRRPDSFKVSE
jgi:hypothetical protein